MICITVDTSRTDPGKRILINIGFYIPTICESEAETCIARGAVIGESDVRAAGRLSL